MFNIKQLAVADTADIHIENSEGEPMYTDDGKPMTITVYGPGTKKFAAAQAERNAKIMESFKRKANKKDSTLFFDDAEFLASITKSFNNFEYDNSKEGKELFLACYLDASIGFIAGQVMKEAGDWANFTTK